jgi:hypothetical protein
MTYPVVLAVGPTAAVYTGCLLLDKVLLYVLINRRVEMTFVERIDCVSGLVDFITVVVQLFIEGLLKLFSDLVHGRLGVLETLGDLKHTEVE